MKISLIWIDKTKDKYLLELINDYLHRLSRYVKYNILELSSVRGLTDRSSVLIAETKQILNALNKESYKIILDDKGQSFTSINFARFIEKHQTLSTKELAFIIGGHFGLSDEVKQKSDLIMSLSSLTFTHDMARLILVEQLYRAYTIINNHPYQK
ncbi:MAG: 23S rRNA (pseudouridine(1915)-N(3))-methyltransferase RlmH [Blastocatellia bacterium]|nr:23S rRNA (pseudouridine(1915)-N(3))-methyltransferase RlmH [Blastocatellia bacterium]MBN8722294.1 23S rRNA (pseudouridine(1915)-N(3))-methyltransferase RlmH [Acidobacteriota bacterium]